MRKFIIGLSILFFALAGYVSFQALEIPLWNSGYQGTSKKTEAEQRYQKTEAAMQKLNEEKAANLALVDELKTKVATLEGELSGKNDEPMEEERSRGGQDETRLLTVLGSGSFDSGQVVINKNKVTIIKDIVPEILASPDHHVSIEGHTSNYGVTPSEEEQYDENMKLSLLRADAIAALLIENGVIADRISIVGYGDTRPLVSNETYEGRLRNRRVEVKLVPKSRVAALLQQRKKEHQANKALIESKDVSYSAEKESTMPVIQPAARAPKPEGRVLAVLGGEMFRLEKIIVDEQLINVINDLVSDIQEMSSNNVMIEGHTDNIPIKPYAGLPFTSNEELSLLRARAVASILEENGISPYRMTVIGHGDTRPAASNGTRSGRARNRRVEVRLVPEKKGN